MMPRREFWLLYLLLGATLALLSVRHNLAVPTARPLASLPARMDGWSVVSEDVFSEAVMDNLMPTDYLSRTYLDGGGRRISLYVGYHDGDRSGAVHSPRLCLPGSGWNVLDERQTELAVRGTRIPVVEAIYQKGESRELFLYWFRLAGEDLSSTYALKFGELKHALLHSRKDVALLRVNLPVTSTKEEALVQAGRFLETFYPQLVDILPRRP